MVDFWSFKMVIAPYIIIIVYAMGTIILPLFLYLMAKKLSFSLNSWVKRTIFIFIVIFMELFWRMLNEFLIVYFKIYQILQ